MKLSTRIALLVLLVIAVIGLIVTGVAYTVVQVSTTRSVDERLALNIGSALARLDPEAATASRDVRVTEVCNAVRSGAAGADGDATQVAVIVDGEVACVRSPSLPVLNSASVEKRAFALRRQLDGKNSNEENSAQPIESTGVIERWLAPAGAGEQRVYDSRDAAIARLGVSTVNARQESQRSLVAYASPDIVLVATTNNESRQAAMRQLRVALVVLLAGLLVIAGGASAVVARLALRRHDVTLNQIEQALEDPALTARVGSSQHSDLQPVVDRVNTLLDRLAATIAAQRELIADAAHELRTPVTSIRANLGVLEHMGPDHPERDQVLRDAQQQVVELSGMADALVELARSRQESLDRVVPVELGALLGEVVARAQVVHPSAVIELTDDPAGPLEIQGDPDLLRRALSELIDNAVKFSPSEGARVRITRAGRAVRIADEGDGVAAADERAIFEPFHRAPSARATKGSGLGLAMVSRVAELHGGVVRSVPSEIGAVFEFAVGEHSENPKVVASVSSDGSPKLRS